MEDANTNYNSVSEKNVLYHLTMNCGGLDDTVGVDIHLDMSMYSEAVLGVPEYILLMEKEQKKDSCANIPIEDAYLAAVATRSIRASQAFPVKRQAWDSPPVGKRT